MQDSSRGSLEDQPGSDDSLCRVGGTVVGSVGTAVDGKTIGTATPLDASTHLDALYAEVDLNKKRQQRCTSGGGLGLSGPVNSLMLQRFPDANRLSLSGLTRTTRDSRVDSGSVDMETPLSLSPKSPADPNEDHSAGGGSGSSSSVKKPVPPPRTRLPRKDSDHSVNGNVSDHSGGKSMSSSVGGALPLKASSPSVGTLSGLSDGETYEAGPTTALGELGQAIDQAIASMTAAASEHSDYDVPKPPRSLKVKNNIYLNPRFDMWKSGDF